MSMLAVSPKLNSQINPESLLGYLEFHSIPDLRVPKSDLAVLWSKHALPPEFLPGEIRTCDAFRRATAALKKTAQVNWQGSPYTARLLVREVKSDSNEIVRLLVREVVDSKNEVLDYATVGKIIFYRNSNTVHTHWNNNLLSEYAYDGVLRQMKNTYDEFVNYHTRDTVRNLVAKAIRYSNPVSIIPRSQGKFIPKKNHSLLLGVKSLMTDLQIYAKGQECTMDLIPIVNTAEQRELVARRAGIELAGELETLVAELADHLKGAKDININIVKRITNKSLELQDRVREYEKLVNVRLNVLRSQLAEFINRTASVTEPAEQNVAG